MDMEQIGKWAFLAGLVVCLFTGLFAVPMAVLVLFVLGLLVGFLNVTSSETEKFLLAAIALMMLGAGSIQAMSVLGTTISGALNTILASLIAFVGASALVVAVKTVVASEK